MRVLVVGSTGALGRHLIPRLVEQNHQVRAVVRDQERAKGFRQMGVELIFGDILDAASMITATKDSDAVIHIATAIVQAATTLARPRSAQDWIQNDRIRREGTAKLLRAAEKNGVQRFIQQSTTFIYGDHGSEIVDETTLVPSIAPVPHRQSTVDMEALVRASPLDWTVLRGGAFYGAGTGAEDEWRADAREGRLRLPEDGSALISLCHVTDVARAFAMVLEQAPSGSVFNVVDDEPVSYRNLLYFVAAQAGVEPPPDSDLAMPSLGCCNSRIKSVLGWSPAYPTFRSGLSV